MALKMEKTYWESRYGRDGTSGSGSIGVERTWKWRVIREVIRSHSPRLLKFGDSLSKIIDVGCGDLSFWDVESQLAINVERYIGIDISETVIMRNRKRGIDGWSFIVSASNIRIWGLRAPVVLCMDLLFHIMDDTEFIESLKNLCYYSEDLIFIHTWKYNPLKDSTSDDIYQKYRPLEAYFGIFMKSGFILIEEKPNPNRVGCLYVFKRKDGGRGSSL